MNTKAFVWLVLGTLAVGVGIGAAAIGVVALGDGQAEETGQSSLSMQPPSDLSRPSESQSTGSSLEQIRQQVQSGETNSDERAQPLQQFQGQGGPDVGDPGFAGGDGLTGTIENIEGDVVTVNTLQGPLQAAVGVDTSIQIFAEGTLTDLQTGVRVTVIGERGEGGALIATSVSVLPEGAGGFLGRGFSDRFGSQGGTDSQGRPSQEELAQLRQRIQSGEASPEELAELRQRFQGQGGSGRGGLGFGGREGLTGTIEKIGGTTLTVNTTQGPLQAVIEGDTTIQMFSEGTLADLGEGLRVIVIGQREEGGKVVARSISIIPVGAEGFSGQFVN